MWWSVPPEGELLCTKNNKETGNLYELCTSCVCPWSWGSDCHVIVLSPSWTWTGSVSFEYCRLWSSSCCQYFSTSLTAVEEKCRQLHYFKTGMMSVSRNTGFMYFWRKWCGGGNQPLLYFVSYHNTCLINTYSNLAGQTKNSHRSSLLSAWGTLD